MFTVRLIVPKHNYTGSKTDKLEFGEESHSVKKVIIIIKICKQYGKYQ